MTDDHPVEEVAQRREMLIARGDSCEMWIAAKVSIQVSRLSVNETPSLLMTNSEARAGQLKGLFREKQQPRLVAPD
ncbi:MAG: hypothetical protein JWO48_667 [Bryobacterales bacterium]|nr:hypothetical protein [Bryobacterales bacterium]